MDVGYVCATFPHSIRGVGYDIDIGLLGLKQYFKTHSGHRVLRLLLISCCFNYYN